MVANGKAAVKTTAPSKTDARIDEIESENFPTPVGGLAWKEVLNRDRSRSYPENCAITF